MEVAVFNVKNTLIMLFASQENALDIFEFHHRLALVELYLNERVTFCVKNSYFSPYVFDIAKLKHSQQSSNSQLISEQIFPKNKEIADALYLLSSDSRKLLTNLSAVIRTKIIKS